MIIKKLETLSENTNALVIIEKDGTINLVSYETIVAVIDKEGWLLIKGLYSRTTRKHIGAFVKEFCNLEYEDAKRIYDNAWLYNIHTGEIIFMEKK